MPPAIGAGRLTLAGAALGLAIAAAVLPFLAGIVEVASASYPLWAATTAALVAVVTLAGWLPARRAARVAPTSGRGTGRT